MAKGEAVWDNKVRQDTTLYLCFEDSRLHIQNRLFDITEDAPPNVHFCGESWWTKKASPSCSFTISENKMTPTLLIASPAPQACQVLWIAALPWWSNGQAKFSCIGRDIEYREIKFRRNEDNIWELASDSYENPDLLLPDIVLLVSDFMKDKSKYRCSPSELATIISRKDTKISEQKISKLLFIHQNLLLQNGIRYEYRRSNGSRELFLLADRDDSADCDAKNDNGTAVQNIDPVGTGQEGCK